MKRLFLSIITILSICSCSMDKALLLEPGIARELAQMRKGSISNLKYKIHFNIPESKKELVNGDITIDFNLDKNKYTGKMVLDFKPDASLPEGTNQIKSVMVNGKDAKYQFNNEHIVLKKQLFKSGDNSVKIEFISGNASLNRRDDMMYTLLVPDRARTLFPCFEQPDMKAIYSLTLDMPKQWIAVGNSKVLQSVKSKDGKRKSLIFAPTEPLSTYLFSFVTGEFKAEIFSSDNNKCSVDSITIFYREKEEQKVKQLRGIADEVFASLKWMEDYTGVKYPFSKYDLIILPGFQYGGMEHTGATLYNNGRMFVPEKPTIQQLLARTQLIAHETAHMWFGDYVTMNWFSDVWVKEVFANFFASKIVEPIHPEVNFALNDLSFYTSSYSEERTSGTTPIEQILPNLKYAGLIYGNIIYQKSPVVMKMLYAKLGAEKFKKAIRQYLNKYKYSNASCEDLINIFAANSSDSLTTSKWCNYWFYGSGMPEAIVLNPTGNIKEAKVVCDSSDQILKNDTIKITEAVSPYFKSGHFIWPNTDGSFYGYINLDKNSIEFIMRNLYNTDLTGDSPLLRKSTLITLYENYLHGKIAPSVFIECLGQYLIKEKHKQILPYIISLISTVEERDGDVVFEDVLAAKEMTISEYAEKMLLDYSKSNADKNFATQAFMTFSSISDSKEGQELLYKIWSSGNTSNIPIKGLNLSPDDFTGLAYKLCVHSQSQTYIDKILATQRARITNPDKIAEFDFVSRAVTCDTAKLDKVFASLLTIEGRRPEPWALKTLSLLNNHCREQYSRKYILQGLENLEEIQRTTDIFFPSNWIGSLIGGHYSKEAASIVDNFILSHNNYPVLLMNKIKQKRYYMPQTN